MSFNTVINEKQRSKILKWLHYNTTIKMESGFDLWPFRELDNYHGDIIIKASNNGIAIIIPLRDTVSSQAGVGRMVDPKTFCQKILSKYAIKNKKNITHENNKQLNIDSIRR